MYVSVVCPSCGRGRINIEPHRLLQGASFDCGVCGVPLSLSEQGVAARGVKAVGERRQPFNGVSTASHKAPH